MNSTDIFICLCCGNSIIYENVLWYDNIPVNDTFMSLCIVCSSDELKEKIKNKVVDIEYLVSYLSKANAERCRCSDE